MNKIIISLSLLLALVAGLVGCTTPASSPLPEPTIDEIFLSRWGHPYYNNAPRVSYNSLDVDKLLTQISLQIPWQTYYEEHVFDCSEMSAYIEYVLERHGYIAEIAHGEVKGSGFHVWVLVYNDDANYWMPIETTSPTGTLDALIMALFQWIPGASPIDYLHPTSRYANIYDVKPITEYDWWHSPYADQLVAASDRAMVSNLELPPLPDWPMPDLPPLPDWPMPD